MLEVMLQKLWHKKWMVICLLSGCSLLIATAVSFPMYREAAFNRMLQDEFNHYLYENSEWPVKNSMVMISKKNIGGKNISRMETFTDGLCKQLGVTEKENIRYYSLGKVEAQSQMKRDDLGKLGIRLGYMSDLPEHIALLAGEMYSDTGITEADYIETVISESAMVSMNLLVGEHIEFSGLKTVNGDTIRIKIVGVYTVKEQGDFYWQNTPDSMDTVCLMNEELFREYFTGDNAEKYTITCTYNVLYSYEDIKASDVAMLKKEANKLLKESAFKNTMNTPEYLKILERYEGKKIRIDATLFILQIPVLILLCAFLFMISGQMYQMEMNEISVLKSRGASAGQIFRLYLYQNLFLTFIGMVLGLPLGGVFCRLLGSADNFLKFNIKRELQISYTPEVFGYALLAVVMSVLITTLPTLKHSRFTIVKLKQQKALKKNTLWEKCFLDLIFLCIAFYGFYNYSNNTEALTQRVLKGEALDPLLYISSSLFILGSGLLLLRIQPYVVKGINKVGLRWWKPAPYASFMEIIKNGRKQQFIMIFMILTISLGMFHATVARTILRNAEDNKEYLDGADLIIQEVWGNNAAFVATDNTIEFQYYEPDYSRYATMAGAQSYTKVLVDKKAYVSQESNKRQNVTVMGIHTKEFGENTHISDALLAEPYHQYLNELALKADGVLVSKNFKTILGYQVGDTIAFSNNVNSKASGKIVGFFDYWPTYQLVSTSLTEAGELSTSSNYMIVGHLSNLQQYWGVTPYQVWITKKADVSSNFFYDWIKENNVSVRTYTDRDKDLQEVKENPLLQGTNGVLTMSFIVMILLCAVGYLIYWIMSIRSREMMFGVLRACGMHKREIFQMLIIEQVFSGIFSIVAGIAIGKMTSKLFVPMIQTAYAASDQVLPMKLITDISDMVRLYGVIAGVMAICLIVLTVLVFKLNIAKALKLGEE